MILLDTDHLSELQWSDSDEAQQLASALESARDSPATSIVNVEEEIRGWMALIARMRAVEKQIDAYQRLQSLLEFLADWEIVPWNSQAADVFHQLRGAKLRLGTMDLKIASIAIANNALLLSRNLRDFQQVPGLRVENWLV